MATTVSYIIERLNYWKLIRSNHSYGTKIVSCANKWTSYFLV